MGGGGEDGGEKSSENGHFQSVFFLHLSRTNSKTSNLKVNHQSLLNL